MEIFQAILVILILALALIWLFAKLQSTMIITFALIHGLLSIIYFHLSGELLAYVNLVITLLIIIAILFIDVKLKKVSIIKQLVSGKMHVYYIMASVLLLVIAVTISAGTIFSKIIPFEQDRIISIDKQLMIEHSWIILLILSLYSLITFIMIKGVIKKR
ncbi:MAG: hypothetical protein H8D45_00180 [Bacteroidetes bacterium]|nr:hypothetical protein [Bacteroidota bacterium]